MAWRTASSNSIGPGMSSDGCSGWFDMLAGISGAFSTASRSGGFLEGMIFPRSSTSRALRSVEKGVFSSKKGFDPNWLEKRSRRAVGREGATVTVTVTRRGLGSEG